MKQLHKLIHVLRVEELPGDASVDREVALIKVGVGVGKRAEVLEIVEIFRANVIDVDVDALIVEVTGSPDKVARAHRSARALRNHRDRSYGSHSAR